MILRLPDVASHGPVQEAGAPGPDTQQPDAAAAGEAQNPDSPGQIILVVDDNEAVLAAFCEMIESLGYRAICANDGFQALSLFDQHREIACVLTDEQMPRMGGVDLCRRLRDRAPQLPLVMIAGRRIDHPDLPPNTTTLVKPVFVEQLEALLGGLLGRG